MERDTSSVRGRTLWVLLLELNSPNFNCVYPDFIGCGCYGCRGDVVTIGLRKNMWSSFLQWISTISFDDDRSSWGRGKNWRLRAQPEQAEGDGRQEQGWLGKLHLSCVWMCQCNPISVVGHFLGCSCTVEVGNADEVWAFVLK
jgi:hypothetical protein